ncbi:hypothetical protein NPIL_511271 [Nephila pilipes]|uniref:Uncharacterized protein n=1 Tax=Nephila pilipes TaxID=299642 RepID=A0A8X6MQQ2_NEPPI|nr:hypothetical protein NPIL_511271 [Nephila pilipes]
MHKNTAKRFVVLVGVASMNRDQSVNTTMTGRKVRALLDSGTEICILNPTYVTNMPTQYSWEIFLTSPFGEKIVHALESDGTKMTPIQKQTRATHLAKVKVNEDKYMTSTTTDKMKS